MGQQRHVTAWPFAVSVESLVERVVLEVSGRGVHRVEEGPDRRQMLGGRASGVIGPPAGESIARRGAGEPGVVTGARLHRVIRNGEDLTVDREAETVRGRFGVVRFHDLSQPGRTPNVSISTERT